MFNYSPAGAWPWANTCSAAGHSQRQIVYTLVARVTRSIGASHNVMIVHLVLNFQIYTNCQTLEAGKSKEIVCVCSARDKYAVMVG